MGIFGWSLPPGCSMSDIDPLSPEPWEMQPRCQHCKSFLPSKSDRQEPWEDKGINEWNQEEIYAAGWTDIWTCKRCGQETRISQ